MDFFDKLGNKVGETLTTIKESDATKKAKNYAGIPGLTIQVGKQEAALKKLYQEIGEAYYAAHKDVAGDEYTAMMQKITDTIEQIEELKDEIEAKKKYDPANDRTADVVSEEETQQVDIVVESTEVTKDTEEVKEEVQETAEEIKDAFKADVEETKEAVKEGVEEAKDVVKEGAEEVKEAVQEAAKETEEE